MSPSRLPVALAAAALLGATTAAYGSTWPASTARSIPAPTSTPLPTTAVQFYASGMGLKANAVNYGAIGAVIGHEITHGFDDRGFLSFAQLWRSVYRPELERLQLRTDPHSPPRFRVAGVVANLPELDAAFECRGKTALLPAKERAAIW